MDIAELLRSLVFLVGSICAISLFVLAMRIMFANKNDISRSRNRLGSLSDVFSGRIKTIHNGNRDYSVNAGLAFNKKTNKWVEQGALSEESIDSILLRH